MIMKILKNVALAMLCVVALMVAGVGLLIALSMQSNGSKDREFKKKLQPSIAWVESFEKSHNRLPTLEEFRSRPDAENGDNGGTWLETDGFWDCPDKPAIGKSARPFCVQIWRGEDTLHYHSWDGKYVIVEPK